jgi:flagellar FliJ protein
MAKSFKFRLDPLLRIREHAEEQRKRALAEVVGKLNEQTQRAQRYQDLIRGEHHRMRSGGLVGQVNVRELAHHRAYVGSVMRAMVETLCERATTQQNAGRAKAELIEAVKQRRVLDRLRERRRSQWQREIDRQEQNELDEMGVQRHARRRDVGPGAGEA